MEHIKNQINKVADYLDDNFEKIMATSQVIMVGIMMLCVLVCVIANLLRGNIRSFLGVAVSLIFIYLIYSLLRITWQELQDDLKK